MPAKNRGSSQEKGGAFWQAICLDFDGVVVESTDIKTEAFRQLFSCEPRALVRRILRYHATHMGVSRNVKFAHIYESILHRPLTPADQIELGRQFSRMVKDRVIRCPLVRGAAQFMDHWSGVADLYLVSGTPQFELRSIVQERKLAHYFRGVYGSPRTKDEIVREILTQKKYDRRRVVFVGDAMTDLHAAAQLKIPFVGRALHPRCFHPFHPPLIRDLHEFDKRLTVARGGGPWGPPEG